MNSREVVNRFKMRTTEIVTLELTGDQMEVFGKALGAPDPKRRGLQNMADRVIVEVAGFGGPLEHGYVRPIKGEHVTLSLRVMRWEQPKRKTKPRAR